MSLIGFLYYPVYYDPRSPRAVDYVMKHFFSIRSITRLRQVLKYLGRPMVPLLRKMGRAGPESRPFFELVSPYLSENRIEVIIDARRFFRLVDFHNRVVISVLKESRFSNYFENEIEARKRLSGADFIPQLLHVDAGRMVFVEEYVCEHPFKSARLKNLDPHDFIDRIMLILRQVHDPAPVQDEEYVNSLVTAILSRPEVDREIVRFIHHLRDRSPGSEEIELVFSHGDFRKDQIFFAADGSLKIIDWECSGFFSRYFDIMELYITEQWFYKNSNTSLKSLIRPEWDLSEAHCYLYLLELCHFPIRFKRNFQLTQSVPIIKRVEDRIRRYALTRR